MLRRLISTLIVFILMLVLISSAASCSTRGVYSEATIEEILAAPSDYAGQRVLVSGRCCGLVKIALAVDYYWTDWGICDGNHVLEVYLVSDSGRFWNAFPDHEAGKEIRLPGVVTLELLGGDRFASAFLLVNVEDVDIEAYPLAEDTEPGSLVGKLIGGTGEIVSVDREEGRCVIETEDGVRLSFRWIELPSEYQTVGLHVRFAAMGRIAGDNPEDGIPIGLYYIEKLD